MSIYYRYFIYFCNHNRLHFLGVGVRYFISDFLYALTKKTEYSRSNKWSYPDGAPFVYFATALDAVYDMI